LNGLDFDKLVRSYWPAFVIPANVGIQGNHLFAGVTALETLYKTIRFLIRMNLSSHHFMYLTQCLPQGY